MLPHLRLAVIVACFWVEGCDLTKSSQSPATDRPPSAALEPAGNVVQIYLVFLERRLGDPFLDRKIWDSTEHVVDIERHFQVLEANGLRVGRLIGIPSGELMTLLNSDRACVNPRDRRVPRGGSFIHRLGDDVPRTVFAVKDGNLTEEVSLEDAQFALDIATDVTETGQTRLQVTPIVEHRRSAFPVGMAADQSGWTIDADKPQRRFPNLGWDVVLAPGETLIIGANRERPGTFGYRSFIQEDVLEPVQRVLILRAIRRAKNE